MRFCISAMRKWKAQETDKYIALWVQYIVLVCPVYTYYYKFIEVIC